MASMTQELARKTFTYKDGDLFWIESPSTNVKAGSVAGHSNTGKDQRRQVGCKGKLYIKARLVYVWHHGEIPAGLVIDHIDRDPTNDRIENLQAITRRANNSRRIRKNGLPTGVIQRGTSFYAYLFTRENGKTKGKSLGTYATAEEASAAYQAAIAIVES